MTQNLLKNLFCTENYVAALSGTIFACLGLLMLLKNGIAPSQGFHWWALFILLPALLFFGCAWLAAHYQFPYQGSLVLFGLGLIVLTVAAMFLLNLSWETWWPLMVITPALPLFLLGLPDSSLASKPEVAAWAGLMSWIGAAMILLGVTFLAGNFHLIDLQRLTEHVGWWGGFILLCAIGAALNGAWLWLKTGEINLSALGLELIAIFLLITAIFEWFRINWWLGMQVMLIATGMLLILSSFVSGRSKVSP